MFLVNVLVSLYGLYILNESRELFSKHKRLRENDYILGVLSLNVDIFNQAIKAIDL